MAEVFTDVEVPQGLESRAEGVAGPYLVGPGRDELWAKWLAAVQVEFSSNEFWKSGDFSFLQRPVPDKLRFAPPDEDAPNYYPAEISGLLVLVEALARGTVMLQARARGTVRGDLEGLPALIRQTHRLTQLEPRA